MTVYRDVGAAIARIMSIEANDGTAKAGWQSKYEAGFELPMGYRAGEKLSPEERLTQDSMARAMLRRALPEECWHALVAKYSINDLEVAQSVLWLIPRVVSPAHHLFKTKCVTAWARPQKRGRKGQAKSSHRGLPDAFYVLASWDDDGTPERTLRHWRSVTVKWLEGRVSEAFAKVETVLEDGQLLVDDVA
ncbi:hypothetical protein [Pseudomonas tohonis]|uniref:hypothetical protein n=1 Tax=Pseudomonas tohonis TaxID=2725477 RepID=UPI001F16F590|nr:hypothetical protein [Pseudomonas tohonis]